MIQQEWPHGEYELWADDDAVIGLKVAETHPIPVVAAERS